MSLGKISAYILVAVLGGMDVTLCILFLFFTSVGAYVYYIFILFFLIFFGYLYKVQIKEDKLKMYSAGLMVLLIILAATIALLSLGRF